MLNYQPKRITAFVGHYGSGKTEVALNYAIWLKKTHEKVYVVDMDTVNPYFRTKDAEHLLASKGIRMIASNYANSNVDVPVLPAQVFSVFDDKTSYNVLDIGGDDDGATVLGAYYDRFQKEDYDLFCVLNQRRLMTSTVEEAIRYIKDIESASRLKITGLINNTNLGSETTAETVLNSLDYAKKISEETGTTLIATAALEELSGEVGQCENFFPIKINIQYKWL